MADHVKRVRWNAQRRADGGTDVMASPDLRLRRPALRELADEFDLHLVDGEPHLALQFL